jgi:hypothetical protein
MPRYNHRIQQMLARASSGLRIDSLHSFLLALLKIAALFFVTLFSSLLLASNLGDTARQLADRISAVTGPGSIALEVTNRSSLDDKSLHEVRSELEAQLRAQGVESAVVERSIGTVHVILSESLREYVWTAEITIGTDQPRVVLVSLPRQLSDASLATAPPISLKKTFLISQKQPILDAVLLMDGRASPVPLGPGMSPEVTTGSRLLVLDATRVAAYRQQSGRWEPETALPITRAHPFPRDLRGRLQLRHDHLFDVYLPGTVCHSSAAAPLTINCSPSDDPWPLTAEDTGPSAVRAFFAPTRNFFTGVLSPGIGRVSNVPSFYSAAELPRANYMLWMLAAIDGSTHLIDGITDQAIPEPHWGSDLAAVHSSCGAGIQLLVDESGEPERDTLRAFEIPDREPVAVSAALEFDGRITALWSDSTSNAAVAIVKRDDKLTDAGQYEANRITVSCAN